MSEPLTRRLAQIATRCTWVNVHDDDDRCDSFGPTRQIKWVGQRNLDEWRLCSRHVEAMKAEFGDLIVRIRP
jgi:hypothetical protein